MSSYMIDVVDEPVHDNDIPVTDCLDSAGVMVKSLEFNNLFVRITFYCSTCEKEWTKEYLDYAAKS